MKRKSQLSSGWNWFLLGISIAGCYLFLLFTFWPGIRDGDTIELIWYARAGYFANYQSPLLGVLWQALDKIAGTELIFISQIALVVSASVLALVQYIRGWWLVIALPIILMSPPIAPYAGTMVKDVWFGCTFLLAIIAYWHYVKVLKARWLAVAIVLFAAAMSFRPIGLFGLCPVLLHAFLQILDKRNQLQRATTTLIVIILAAVFGVKGMTPLLRQFYRIDSRPAQQIIYLSDLSALTLATQDWLLPPEANPDNIDMTRLKELFKPHACDNLVTYKPWQENRLLLTEDPGIVKIYRKAWISGISKYPLEYLKRRWDVLNYFFGFYPVPDSYKPSGWFYQKVSESYLDEPTFTRKGWSDKYLSFLDWLEKRLPVSALWPYVLVCLSAASFSLMLNRPNRVFIAMVAFSFVSYSTGFALVTYHTAYRYHWPTAFASILLVPEIFCCLKVILHEKLLRDRGWPDPA